MVLKKVIKTPTNICKHVATINLISQILNKKTTIVSNNSLYNISISKLEFLLKVNKITPWIFQHLSHAEHDKILGKDFSSLLRKHQKILIVQKEVYLREIKLLDKHLKRENIAVLLVKDFSNDKLMKFHQKYQLGNDLDLVINKADFKKLNRLLINNKYQLQQTFKLPSTNSTESYYIHEKHYTKKNSLSNIDVHFEIAKPILHITEFLSRRKLKQFKTDMFQSIRTQKSGLKKLSPERKLVFLVLHFIAHENLRGLKNFLEIVEYGSKYETEIKWNKLFKIAKKYKLERSIIFLFLAGSRIFNIKIPKYIRRKKNNYFIINILSRIVIMKNFLVSHDIFDTNQSKRKIIQQKLVENNRDFLLFFLIDNLPVTRIFRIKIMYYLLVLVFHNATFELVKKLCQFKLEAIFQLKKLQKARIQTKQQ